MEKIITTLTSYPGKKITKVFEIVYAYDTDLRFMRSRWDSDSRVKQSLISLYENAVRLGGNAVLGVQIAYLEDNVPFLMGTAVYLEDEE